MSNGEFPADREINALPYSITRLYPGKQIIYSEDEQRVIGVGDTLEEAEEQAKQSGVGGLWHYGYGEPDDTDTVPAIEFVENDQAPANRPFQVLPPEITRRYPGQVIVYSEDQQRVIGVGETEDEAFDQAEASGVKGLWHVHFAAREDAEDL